MIFFQVSSSNLPFILDPQLFIIALFKVSIQPTEVLASFHKLSVAGALSLPWPTQSTSPWETLSTATPRGSGNPASFTLGAGAILAAVSMVIALFTGSHANELTTWPRCIMQCKHCWYCQTSIKKNYGYWSEVYMRSLCFYPVDISEIVKHKHGTSSHVWFFSWCLQTKHHAILSVSFSQSTRTSSTHSIIFHIAGWQSIQILSVLKLCDMAIFVMNRHVS